MVDLFGGGEAARARLETSTRRMLALAAAEGLPMTARTHTYNSRLAQELGSWATERGLGPQYHDAAFRALDTWTAEVASLTDVTERIG